MSATDRLARVVMSRFAAAGADRMFGVPGGGPNLQMIRRGAEAGIGFALTHGETAACIAAGAYGKLRGVPGLVAVTRGPGLASAANGMAQATLDRFPLVLLSDSVPAAHRDRVAHQRFDQVAAMAPLSKWSGTLGYGDTEPAVDAACRLAMAAPAGAVHFDFDATAPGERPPEPPHPVEPDAAALDAARELVAGSRRPVFLVGNGAGPHASELRHLVESMGIPALVTYQAKGVIPDTSPSYGGLFTNSLSERPLVEAADLIVAVDLDAVEPLPGSWTYDAPVLALNTRPTTDTYWPAAVEVAGPLGGVLGALEGSFAPAWPAYAGPEANRRVLEALRTAGAGFSPFELMEAVAGVLAPQDPVVTIDAGAHFLVIMPLWPVRRPLDLLISNGLATMGFALPAAIGAALARPDRRILCLVGDGGLGMTLAELETVARLGLDITVVVFNDSTLSLIDIKQASPSPEGVSPVRYGPSDFASVARAMGMAGFACGDAGEVRRALRAAGGPCLIDARIDPGVYPHVIAVARG